MGQKIDKGLFIGVNKMKKYRLQEGLTWTIAVKLKSFLEKMLFNDADKITDIIGFNETELEEYHERQVLNADVKWIPGQPYWKGRKHTQKTKNRISETLRAKGWKGTKRINTLGTV